MWRTHSPTLVQSRGKDMGGHSTPRHFYTRVNKGSSGKMQGLRDDQTGIGWLMIIVVAILGIFGFSALASINWKAILALFAAGIIAIAMFGVVFMHQDFKIAMYASILALLIVFIVEVSFPMIIGGLIILFAMYNYSSFSKRPIVFVMMIGVGLLMMILARTYILVPLGVLP